jgi:gluconokinase
MRRRLIALPPLSDRHDVLEKESTDANVIRPNLSGDKVIFMGVSGSGKTTLAARFARAINAEFHDADDYHDAASVAKMREGIALTDADRVPWLRALNALLRDFSERGEGVVLACSALRETYRDAIASGIPNVRWVFLDGDFETIAARMRARSEATNHYMPESLLKSQFETLERPSDAIVIDVALSTEAQLQCVLASFASAA